MSKPAGDQVPLTQAGKDIDLHPVDQRWDAPPFATATFDDCAYNATPGGATPAIDFTKATPKRTPAHSLCSLLRSR